MSNEGTKKQLKDLFDKQYREANNPDSNEEQKAIIKEYRNKKRKRLEKGYGV